MTAARRGARDWYPRGSTLGREEYRRLVTRAVGGRAPHWSPRGSTLRREKYRRPVTSSVGVLGVVRCSHARPRSALRRLGDGAEAAFVALDVVLEAAQQRLGVARAGHQAGRYHRLLAGHGQHEVEQELVWCMG